MWIRKEVEFTQFENIGNIESVFKLDLETANTFFNFVCRAHKEVSNVETRGKLTAIAYNSLCCVKNYLEQGNDWPFSLAQDSIVRIHVIGLVLDDFPCLWELAEYLHCRFALQLQEQGSRLLHHFREHRRRVESSTRIMYL